MIDSPQRKRSSRSLWKPGAGGPDAVRIAAARRAVRGIPHCTGYKKPEKTPAEKEMVTWRNRRKPNYQSGRRIGCMR